MIVFASFLGMLRKPEELISKTENHGVGGSNPPLGTTLALLRKASATFPQSPSSQRQVHFFFEKITESLLLCRSKASVLNALPRQGS